MRKLYQRCEMRSVVSGDGLLAWNWADEAHIASVQVRNFSGQGVQVVCARAVETGAVVFLTGDSYECLGAVKYCVLAEEGFRIGIQLTRAPYPRAAEGVAPS